MKPVADAMLRAGVARADITPPVGIDLGGFYTRIGPSTHVLDPLSATALLLRTDETGVLIVACDLLSFRGELGLEVRRALAEAASLPEANVLPAASHTHSGPVLGTHLRTSLHTGQDLPAIYRANLLHTLAGLARAAARDLRPARFAVGQGQSDIGVNRRERLAGGRIVIGMNEDGPADDAVGVVRIDGLDGRTLAVLVNYACHPIVLGPQSRAISADFPGAMRRVVQVAADAPCLFLQGACGDVGPISGEDAGAAAVQRLGALLGHEVARVFWSVDPRPVERRKVIFESVAPLTNVIETPLPEPAHHLAAAEQRIDLPLQEPPSREEAERALARLTEDLRQFSHSVDEARGSSDLSDDLETTVSEGAVLLSTTTSRTEPPPRLPQRERGLGGEGHTDHERIARARIEVQHAWYNFLLDLYERGAVPRSVPVTVAALRLNDLGIVSLPLEPFIGIGLAIKAASPAPHTWVVGYTHGCAGYVPSAQAHAEGGYEVETSYKLYRLPAPFAPEAYDLLIETGVALLRRLFPPTDRQGDAP